MAELPESSPVLLGSGRADGGLLLAWSARAMKEKPMGESLSMLEKTIRLSLCAYPRPLDVTQFYPALSTYKVARVFSLGEIEAAVSHYLVQNPFFARCHVVEREFDSPEAFPLSSFQGVVVDEYPKYHDGFLLMSVTYRSRPELQGIFTAFPLSMQDGYVCFRFHQALMKSLKSGRDEFQLAETQRRLGVRTSELEPYLPERRPPARLHEAARTIPFRTREAIGPRLRIGSYLEEIKSRFLERGCENLFVIKNASYTSELLFGNYLMFLRVPRDVIAQSTGTQIRDFYNARQRELAGAISSLETVEDFVTAGQRLMPEMLQHSGRFYVNNYGDVSRHDGSDFEAQKGTLVRYQWHMPNVVLSLMTGDRAGVAWTITVGDKGLFFESV